MIFIINNEFSKYYALLNNFYTTKALPRASRLTIVLMKVIIVSRIKEGGGKIFFRFVYITRPGVHKSRRGEVS
jgi:hypothetical protein